MIFSYKILKTRDTGVELMLDHPDWINAREVAWFQEGEEILNTEGVKLQDYLKIKGKKLLSSAQYDFRRSAFDA